MKENKMMTKLKISILAIFELRIFHILPNFSCQLLLHLIGLNTLTKSPKCIIYAVVGNLQPFQYFQM